MTTTPETTVLQFSPAQAAELSLLVDLEARWENLRVHPPATQGKASTVQDLHQRQRAYEVFFDKLGAYNKLYKPPHVPELQLTKAPQLGAWCRRMRELHLRIQHDSRAYYPVHLLEKAYRLADRLAHKMKRDCITRPTRVGNLQAVIRELEDLAHWCDSLSTDTPESESIAVTSAA